MAKARRVWPRRARRAVQAVAFALFILFIVRLPVWAVRGGQAEGFGLMRLSPYAGLGASIAAWRLMRGFWPALVLVVAAAVLGRFFCGWLCPLGATLDVGDRALARARRRAGTPRARAEEKPAFEHVPGRRVKHYVLLAALAGAFAGLSFYGLLDPLSIAVRSYVLAVHAAVARGLLALCSAFGWSAGTAAVGRALGVRGEPTFHLHMATFATLAAILALGLARRRLWCRYVCPLGAAYALAAKPALTKRSVSDACTRCGRCVEACPMGCISQDGRRTLNDECILCLQCQPVCPVDAVRFLRRAPAAQRGEVDLTRRGALAWAAAGLACYPLWRMRASWAQAKGDPVIRPPLAGRDVEEFLRRCVRCGQCMRACPNQVIQPAGLEAGVESLWTPRLAPRPGYCEYNCNLCGRSCPTGAIPRFSLEEKHRTAMGLAYFDQSRCIPWRGAQRQDEPGFVADQHNCGVCEEVCPAPGKAIRFRRVAINGMELRLPYVRPEACVGCGYCEAACPVQGAAAIRVTGGFRELPATQAAGEVPATEVALPAAAGRLRLAGPKTTYEGADDLFDYVNGGADPYVKFNFVRVTVAEYTDGARKAKAELWQFATSDDAYGAFAKDRRGGVAPLGDEGTTLGGSIWARRGRFALSVLNTGGADPEQTRMLARAALDALREPPAQRPEVCRRLPAEMATTGGAVPLDPLSVLFVRDAAALFRARLADKAIPEATWGFAQGVVAAYGRYGPSSDARPPGLVVVEHGSAADAAAAVGRLAQARAAWGEERVQEQPFAVFRDAGGSFCAAGSVGSRFAAAFYAPSAEAGSALVASALE